tara:strand:+ start:52 stop:249 length:198 start_codon:yes stop_codon:yes gene_type:complete
MTNTSKIILGISVGIIGGLTFMLIRTKKDLTNAEDDIEAYDVLIKNKKLESEFLKLKSQIKQTNK